MKKMLNLNSLTIMFDLKKVKLSEMQVDFKGQTRNI